MKTSTVAAFVRGGYKHETEPVQVIANARILGVWYPIGTEPPEQIPISPVVVTPIDDDWAEAEPTPKPLWPKATKRRPVTDLTKRA